jgi:hypothetical protein
MWKCLWRRGILEETKNPGIAYHAMPVDYTIVDRYPCTTAVTADTQK